MPHGVWCDSHDVDSAVRRRWRRRFSGAMRLDVQPVEPLTSWTRLWTLNALASLCAVTFLALAAERLLDVPHGLNATYFTGPDWGEAAAVSGIDVIPSTDVLKQRRPDFAEHAFSVEWRGYIAILRTGTYTFGTTSDDGSWLSVDGKPVVENPGRHSQVDRQGSIVLSAGVHPVLIRYFQDGGDCAFQATWARNGDAVQPIPKSAWLTE